jgi:hypothetical protein
MRQHGRDGQTPWIKVRIFQHNKTSPTHGWIIKSREQKSEVGTCRRAFVPKEADTERASMLTMIFSFCFHLGGRWRMRLFESPAPEAVPSIIDQASSHRPETQGVSKFDNLREENGLVYNTQKYRTSWKPNRMLQREDTSLLLI